MKNPIAICSFVLLVALGTLTARAQTVSGTPSDAQTIRQRQYQPGSTPWHEVLRRFATARSDACIPFITLVFPVTAVAAANRVEGFDQLDAAQIFRLLVA